MSSTLKASASSWKPEKGENGKAPVAVVAWGKKSSSAVRSAAPLPTSPKQSLPSSNSSNNLQRNGSTSSNRSNGAGWRGRGGPVNGNNNNTQQDNSTNNNRNFDRQNREAGNRGGRGGRGRDNNHNNSNNNRDNTNNNNNNRRGSNQGGRNFGDNNNHNNHRNNNNDNGNNSGWARGKSLPVELCQPGEGDTAAQKAVRRVTVETLLNMRLRFLKAPDEDWNPPEAAAWTDEQRVEDIENLHKTPRMMGDVSPNQRNKNNNTKNNKNDTAPALEDCTPLAVNEETRWKSNVFNKSTDNNDTDEDDESDEEVLKKALLILNKLSLTKFDKLSDAFLDTGITRSEGTMKEAISLVVNKAQAEPHFSTMYAKLCFKLAQSRLKDEKVAGKKGVKRCKKLLLERCQEEFEEDTFHKTARLTKDMTEPEEIKYHTNIIKKEYLGHMRFIGELYKGELIRIGIMLFCLFDLLGLPTEVFTKKNEDDNNNTTSSDNDKDTVSVDEEKVECFSKLMSTVGQSLNNHAEEYLQKNKSEHVKSVSMIWRRVEMLASSKGTTLISNRIKYMLQDLIEMKNKGWVTRRKEETAKTIEQIHKEVEKEERKAARRSNSTNNLRPSNSSNNLSRRSSTNDMRKLDRQRSETKDKDGFTTVKNTGGGSMMNRSNSSNSLRRQSSNDSHGWSHSYSNNNDKVPKMKRNNSNGSFGMLRDEGNNGRSNKRNGSTGSKSTQEQNKPPASPPREKADAAPVKSKTFPSVADCSKSSQNILSQFFVGGDTDDAVLSLQELIGDVDRDDGSLERGAAVFEGCLNKILEDKKENVDKFVKLLVTRLLVADKAVFTTEMLTTATYGILEFLVDVEIDAPLAGTYLAQIVASAVTTDTLKLEFLLTAPDDFRTYGKAAQFAVKVLQALPEGQNNTEDHFEVVEKLMTEADKKEFPTAKNLLDSMK